MYAIYGNIDHRYKPQMLAYIPYMDPVGVLLCVFLLKDGGHQQKQHLIHGRII